MFQERDKVNRNLSVRRSSIQDRTKEILDRNKAGSTHIDDFDDTERLKSYESTLADMMDGISFRNDETQHLSNENFVLSTDMNDKYALAAVEISSPSDSFEISASDLEVGTLASRRAKEKTFDRRSRRQSLDQAPHKSPRPDLKAKRAISPEVSRFRDTSSPVGGNRLNTVGLSSIHHQISNHPQKIDQYSSLEASDNDIYKMLDSVVKNTDLDFPSNIIPTKVEDVLLTRAHQSTSDFSDMTHEDEIVNAGDLDAVMTTARHDTSSVEVDYALDDFEDHDGNIQSPVGNGGSQSKLAEPLSHVDQIMQRWYTNDSEFFKLSLETSCVQEIDDTNRISKVSTQNDMLAIDNSNSPPLEIIPQSSLLLIGETPPVLDVLNMQISPSDFEHNSLIVKRIDDESPIVSHSTFDETVINYDLQKHINLDQPSVFADRVIINVDDLIMPPLADTVVPFTPKTPTVTVNHDLCDAVSIRSATAALKKRLQAGTVHNSLYNSTKIPTRVFHQPKSKIPHMCNRLIESASVSSSTNKLKVTSKNNATKTTDETASWLTLKMEYDVLYEERQQLHEREGQVSLREVELGDRENALKDVQLAHISQIELQNSVLVEENRILRSSEKEHELEIVRLKALIFALQAEERKTSDGFVLGTAQIIGELQDSAENTILSVSRREYERLLRDHMEQESLITGFQKENERLTNVLKIRELEETSQRAAFFDQQEVINREMNRLRNAVCESQHLRDGITLDGSRKVVSNQLRSDLEFEGIIRSLKERVLNAENRANETEKMCDSDKEKLTKENRILTQQVNNLTLNKNAFIKAEVEKQHLIVTSLTDMNEKMKKKLAWYVDNQVLLDSLGAENSELQRLCSSLKQKLKQEGFADGDRNAHLLSDEKKIKELEITVSELKSVILNRNPNCVTSLVHAASVSNTNQVTLKEQQNIIHCLRRELEESGRMHSLKFRGLRQEYDRLKDRLDFNRVKLPTEQSNTGNKLANMSENELETHQLSAANEKLRDMEAEMSRLRAFYVQKLEELQNKHDFHGRTTTQHGTHIDDKFTMSLSEDQTVEIHSMYLSKIKRLETDLLNSSRELGQLRAKTIKDEAEIETMDRKWKQALELQERVYKDKLQQQKLVQSLESGRLMQNWMSERDLLLNQLRSAEVNAAVGVGDSTKRKTDDLENVGWHIRALDHRLQTRDIEFALAVENCQKSHIFERARLMAVHQQELKEKDFHLEQIRLDLNQLLVTLNHLQTNDQM